MKHTILRLAFLALVVMAALAANAAPLRVAVMDSGYSGKSTKLCKEGHYDASTNKAEVGRDEIQHGTYVLDTIERSFLANSGAKGYSGAEADYCFIVIKVFTAGRESIEKSFIRAYTHLYKIKPDVVNMSFSSVTDNGGKDEILLEEKVLISLANSNTVLFMAAGNVRSRGDKENANLSEVCHVFPACLAVGNKKNMHVIGGYLVPGTIHPQSYYGGPVDEYEPFCDAELEFCGTSHATPVAVGKYIAEFFRRKAKPPEHKIPDDYVVRPRDEKDPAN
jgi:hypothetical protein